MAASPVEQGALRKQLATTTTMPLSGSGSSRPTQIINHAPSRSRRVGLPNGCVADMPPSARAYASLAAPHWFRLFAGQRACQRGPECGRSASSASLPPFRLTVRQRTSVSQKILTNLKIALDAVGTRPDPRPPSSARIDAFSRLRAPNALDQHPPLLESKIPDKYFQAASPMPASSPML